MDAAHTSRIRRAAATSRLLEHCERLRRVTGPELASSARDRLEHELGSDLARRLVGALAPERSGRASLAGHSARRSVLVPV